MWGIFCQIVNVKIIQDMYTNGKVLSLKSASLGMSMEPHQQSIFLYSYEVRFTFHQYQVFVP